MEIKRKDNGANGVFMVIEDETQIAEMTYVWTDDYTIMIDHTEVYSGYEGRGIGKIMFMEAVKFAREKDIKIIPLCIFAKAMFRRFPEAGDVLRS
jgi:predicted GNAT family acetyltransferase